MDDKHIISICNSSLDMTQMVIENRDNKSYSDYLYEEPLMFEEINFQYTTLEYLKNCKKPEQYFDIVIHTSQLAELVCSLEKSYT